MLGSEEVSLRGPSLLAELKQVANLKSAECEDDLPKMILQTYIDIYINIHIYMHYIEYKSQYKPTHTHIHNIYMDRSHQMSSGQKYMLNLNKFNAMHKLGSSLSVMKVLCNLGWRPRRSKTKFVLQ